MRKSTRKALLSGGRGVIATEWPISIRYDVPLLSLQDAADSLVALERFINRVPIVLDSLSTGMRKAYAVPVLNEITHQSPFTEDILVKLFFGSKKAMDRNIAEIRKRLHVKSLADIHPIVPWVVIGGIIVGSGYFGGCLRDQFTAKSAPMGFNNNTIINIGDSAAIKAGDVVSIIEAARFDERRMAEDTVKLLHPAQRSGGDNIQIGMTGGESATIPKESISEVPLDMPPVDRQETVRSVDNQAMDIRAADYDDGSKGWSVILANAQNRIKMVLDPSISPDALAGKTYLRGDVDITDRFDPSANRKKPFMVSLKVLHTAR